MRYPSLKPRPLLLTCFACLCFSSTTSYSQVDPGKYERFTTEDGLSSNVVYCVLQDKYGYLWIGTNDGLNRYDGYNFKTYRTNPNDSTSLPSNAVPTMCEDGSGNLWIGTSSGICRFDHEKNSFQRYTYNGNQADLHLQINKKELLINSTGKFIKLNTQTLSTTILKIPDFAKGYYFGNNAVRSSDKNIYLIGGNTDSTLVLKYNGGQNAFTIYLSYFNDPLLKGLGRVFFRDSRNSSWIGGSREGGLFCHAPGNGPIAEFKNWNSNLNVSATNQIFEDNQGFLWISTTETLFRYNHELSEIKEFKYNSPDEVGNGYSSLTMSVYQDRTGVLWIASYNGLFKLNMGLSRFKQITAKKDRPDLQDNFILGLFPSTENKVWVNYQWGRQSYTLLDLDDYSTRHFDFKKPSIGYVREAWLQNHHFVDESKIQEWFNDYSSKPLPQNLIFDRQKKLWLLNKGNHKNVMDIGDVLKSNSFLVDARLVGDEIWVVTDGEGLQCVNTVTKTVNDYKYHANGNSLSSNHLTCLLAEENGNLWIGTKGAGLNYFDRKKDVFYHFTTQNGLSNNSIFSLVRDEKGRLWIGTANGLSCFDTTKKTFKNFSRLDGLVNTEYNRYSACRLPSGYILMGGMNGIDYFHPDSVLVPGFKPEIQITDFKVFNRSVFPYAGIRLPHHQNYVTLEFASMDFRDPSINKYEYKLEGIDEDWVPAGNQHSVSYATLAPGRYHFLVRAIESDGSRSEKAAEISFSIATPWWKTAFFYVVCALSLLGILFLLYKYRITQLKKMMQLRTKISQDLHDDVGATLSGIRLFSQLAKERTENKEEYMDKITHYSDEMLNKLSDIVWSINSENDRFDHLVSKLRNYAQAMTTAKNISLEFSVDPKFEKKELNLGLKKNIYMITREAINNAIKYSDCRQLKIGFIQSNGGAELFIRDDGNGFDVKEVQQGNGLTNMRKRAEQVNAIFNVESKPGSGTFIRFRFKFT